MTNFQPWSTRLTFTNTNPKTSATGVPLGASLSNPYNAFVGGPPFPYNGTFTTCGGIFGLSQNFRCPHAYQTNVRTQPQIARTLCPPAPYVPPFHHYSPHPPPAYYPLLPPLQ